MAGQRVNAPAGARIGAATGALEWTPTDEQVGEVPLTIVVENVAGVALQDVLVVVAPRPLQAGGDGVAVANGCGCSSPAGAGPHELGAALVVSWLVGRLRRRRSRAPVA